MKEPAEKIKRSVKEKREAILLQNELEKQELPGRKFEIFWTIKYNKDAAPIGITIDPLKQVEQIFKLGFRRYDIDKTNIYIHISENKLVKEVTPTTIIDTFLEYVESQTDDYFKHTDRESLISKLYGSLGTYFSTEKLNRLKPKDAILFNTDTAAIKYLYYKNGFIEITKAGTKFKPYSELQNYVWESEILPREYKAQKDTQASYFEQFMFLIANSNPDRMQSIKSIIGYILHDYYDSKLQSLLLTDSKISDDDEANGRTGKSSIFCKGLAYIMCANPDNPSMKTYVQVNGRQFDPDNRSKYEQCSLDTKLIVLDDVFKGFNIETIFNDITEGIMVKHLFKESYRKRVKMIVTTNKTVKIEGASAKDRVIEFEFSDFFNENRSPADHFGHWFFRDWNTEEWQRFDYFMISCIQLYMSQGIIKPGIINLNTRKLYDTTCREFIEYMNEGINNVDITTNMAYDKKKFFEAFTEAYPDYKDKKYTQKRFHQWLVNFTKYDSRFKTFDKITDETKSGNIRYFVLRDYNYQK